MAEPEEPSSRPVVESPEPSIEASVILAQSKTDAADPPAAAEEARPDADRHDKAADDTRKDLVINDTEELIHLRRGSSLRRCKFFRLSDVARPAGRIRSGLSNTHDAYVRWCFASGAGPAAVWVAVTHPPVSNDDTALSAIRFALVQTDQPSSSWPPVDHSDESNVFARSTKPASKSQFILHDETIHFKRQISAVSVHSPVAPPNSSRKKPSVELLVGFASGDLLFHSPGLGQDNAAVTVQLNRQQKIGHGRVVALSWLPDAALSNGELFFFVSFAKPSGYAFVFSTKRVDPEQPLSWNEALLRSWPQVGGGGTWLNPERTNPVAVINVSAPASLVTISSWHMPATASSDGADPLRLTLAVATRDSTLRVLDLLWNTKSSAAPLLACNEIARTRSLYGSFLSVDWSWDDASSSSALIVTGGEDDRVCLWRFDLVSQSLQQLAFAEGHLSFVSAVCFDSVAKTASDVPTSASSSPYRRIFSVGQDTRLIAWEFNTASLSHHHHPTRLHPIAQRVIGPSVLTDLAVIPGPFLIAPSLGGYMHVFAILQANEDSQ